MALLASTTSPQQAYATIKAAAVQLQLNLNGIDATLASKAADYDFVRQVFMTVKRTMNQLQTLRSTSGLSQYAKDQENDQAYDVLANLDTLITALDRILIGIDAQAPSTVTLIKPLSWGDSGTMIADKLTTQQTADLRNVIQLAVAEIS